MKLLSRNFSVSYALDEVSPDANTVRLARELDARPDLAPDKAKHVDWERHSCQDGEYAVGEASCCEEARFGAKL